MFQLCYIIQGACYRVHIASFLALGHGVVSSLCITSLLPVYDVMSSLCIMSWLPVYDVMSSLCIMS